MNWVDLIINGREVKVAYDETSIHIYNAFPIKDELKERGYRWNSHDKSWFITPVDTGKEIGVLKRNLIPDIPDPGSIGIKQDMIGEHTRNLPESFSVIDLRNHIDQIIKNSLVGTIWVRGIVASEIKNYQWASYFDLKDEGEENNIFFKTEAKTVNLNIINRKLNEGGIADSLEKDLPVFFKVNLKLSQKYSVELRLEVIDILPEYTQSKLRNQREITIDKLDKEGLLKKQQQLIMPLLISRIGLITSAQGTSVTDIMAGLNPFENKYEFYFIDSRMEGNNAVANIIKAMNWLEFKSRVDLDAIIIARGGGSEQSLAVFNNYSLCRRICEAKIPTLTAIGHEKDLSAIEICSFFTPTPSTPSGIGEFLQNRFLTIKQNLAITIQQLINFFFNIHNQEKEKLALTLKNLPPRIISFLSYVEERLYSLIRRFVQSASYLVKNQENDILSLKTRIVLSFSFYEREEKLLRSTIKKLDFIKRFKQNRNALNDITAVAGLILEAGNRNILDKEKKITNLIELTNANTPEKILKKGFTLTFNEENRVIKNLTSFNRVNRARLQFFDGSTWIKEDEIK